MKKIIFLIIFLLSIDFLFAQNRIDPPKVFNHQGDTVFVDFGNEFLKMWNWGGDGKKLDDAMHVDFYQGIWPYYTDYCNNLKVFHVFDGILVGRGNHDPFNACGVYYNPVITVDSTNNFKPRVYDSTGAIFGFKNPLTRIIIYYFI